MGAGQSTQFPTVPRVGPNPAVVIGIGSAAMAGLFFGMLALARHRVNSADYVLFDAGWQFQLVVDSPVTLDAAQVAAAAMAPSAN
jgi:hypothetical protein